MRANSGWVDKAVKFGAVLSSLSGFAALATLTGGAITYARFAGSKLPADQAVAVTPTAELVTIGTVALMTFAIAGTLAVLLVYLLDDNGTAGPQNQRGVAAIGILGAIVAVVLSRPPETWRLVLALLLAVAGGRLVLVAARRTFRWRTVVWLALGSRAFEAAMRLLRLRSSGAPHPARSPAVIATRTGAVVTAIVAIGLWQLTAEVWVGIMAATSAALAGLVLHVAGRTGSRFRWYGVAVFLAIIGYGSILSTLRTYCSPKLLPIAVAQTAAAGGAELSGLYVAETSERVYVGDVDHCVRDTSLRLVPSKRAARGRIIELPRASLSSLEIGNLAGVSEAKAAGPPLMDELRRRLSAEGVDASTAPVPHPCASQGIVDLRPRANTVVDGAEAQRLARRFRPILRFDSGELWRPLRIDALLAERDEQDRPRHRLCLMRERGAQEGCEPLGGSVDLAAASDQQRLIDFGGDRYGGIDHRGLDLDSCPGREPDDRLLDCDQGPDSVMYYRVTSANDRRYVDYWWFLRYNRFDRKSVGNLCKSALKRRFIGCFDHEGDWEGVTVVTAVRQPDRLASVGFASHEGVYRFSTTDLEIRNGRPVVYSARGSHASYPVACPRRCRQPAKKYNHALPETNTDGMAPWGRNSEEACFGSRTPCLLPLQKGGWNAFEGRWGSRVCHPKCKIEVGPLSPSRQQRYRLPWCATGAGNRLVCDGRFVAPTLSPPPPRAP